MLTPNQIAVIKATAPAVAANANRITGTFYPLMFERFPEVRSVFNQSHQRSSAQPEALANAIIAYASNIDRLEVLGPAVEGIVQKHVSLNITPDQYEIVGTCLMEAIGKVLGEAVTAEVADAWGAAYWQLARLLIAAEEQEYARKAALSGGWRGARRFKIVEKTPESTVITSFRLAPVDGGPVMDFLPGQYLGLRLAVGGETVHRNYSLSASPNGRDYRISVKREPHGLVSAFLHDSVQVGDMLDAYPPAGEFVLRDGTGPLLLVTGGVGQTPALPLAEQALAAGRTVIYVHAALNGSVHAFRGQVDRLAALHQSFKPVYCYADPQPGDRPHMTGLLDRDRLAALLPDEDGLHAYVVGPKPFMAAVIQALTALGLPPSSIVHEFFGPREALA
ncbi:NO-inducible flavohemoprotein [Azospirillum picis]|uniref:nitric oxide dioxygenase n=1 Tax=Azospirillum picis TaxID=488438 RepID=A0ABU0MUL9_9PROT|nr:NO-inducible flavohemoprotein [Azospirillum picis]MBP2303351.1 nitric oxide dioxygenase [Azospirillum picis]MDQ0537192.1 nitric oxide dioxygenase [Azospirillum picis]